MLDIERREREKKMMCKVVKFEGYAVLLHSKSKPPVYKDNTTLS